MIRDVLKHFPSIILAGLALLLLGGCASTRQVSPSPADLAQRLRCLGPRVASFEAAQAAEVACAYSLELARNYRVGPPPALHNILVNTGFRERGLCYHWADDLSAKLQSLNLKTLQLRRAVARLETRREHSSIVITAPGQPFDHGIVLDAWRKAGQLFWGPVKEDRYPWIEVEVIPDGAHAARAPGSKPAPY